MSKPLVSIIITNYNYGQFVAEAITSALKQTYSNTEIIVVDDGSTDNSLEIIQQFDQYITITSQANSGVVVARNMGAARSKGEYLCFLDADDKIAPDFIAKLIQPFLDEVDPKLAFTYCDFHYFGDQEHIIKSCPWNPRKLLYRNYVIVSALIKAKPFGEIGGFDNRVNQKASFEDWDLWLSLMEFGYTGHYIPEALFHYRLHGRGRNQAALAKRNKIENNLHKIHPKLYKRWDNRLYLAVFGTASKIRNKLIKAPGT